MKGKIKAIGLTMIAALAMSAMFASAASAQTKGVFTAGETPGTHTGVELKGTQYGDTANNFFEIGPAGNRSKTHCLNSGVSFSGGDPDGTATSLTITPVYKDCVATADELPVTFTMNGCDYVFDQPHTNEGEGLEWTGTVDLVCPGTNVIEVHVYLFGSMTSHSFNVCTVTVEEFQNLGVVTYDNVSGNPDDVTVKAEVTGIPYVKHGSSCPGGSGTGNDTEITSTVTLEDAASVDDVWISHEE